MSTSGRSMRKTTPSSRRSLLKAAKDARLASAMAAILAEERGPSWEGYGAEIALQRSLADVAEQLEGLSRQAP